MSIKTRSQIAPAGRAGLIQAAGIVSAAFVISRILGLVRVAVIANYYGVDSLEANAYEIASRIPEAIFYVVAGGALGSAFIPTFAAYFSRDDPAGGWQLFSAVINLITLVLLILSAVMALLARPFLQVFFPNLMGQPELLAMTTSLLQIILVSTIIFGISGVFMGALNARHHFLLPAVAPILYNLGIIGGAILFAPNVFGLAIGTVLGAAGHLLVQWPGLRQQQARYQFRFSLSHPGLRQVLRLMGPRVLGLSFGQLNSFITLFLGQFAEPGAIPALGNGWRIMIMPQGIIGQAIGVAVFPTLADLAARQAFGEMRRIVADMLRLIFFLGLPVSVVLGVLPRPVVALFLQRGQFDQQATELVAWGLVFYGVGLIPLATLEIISRAFYALGDTKTPVLVGALQLVVAGAAGYFLSQTLFPAIGWLALGGLALGISLANGLEAVGLLWLLRGRLAGLDGRYLWDGLWRMALAAGLMGLVMVVGERWLAPAGTIPHLIISGSIGSLTYGLACWLLDLRETRQITSWLQHRFTR